MTEDAPVRVAVVYPARVRLPAGQTMRGVKVFITAAAVYVYAGGPSGVTEVFSANYDLAASTVPSSTAPRSASYDLATTDGQLRAWRTAGCGCHAAALKASRGPFTDTAERTAVVR